jgi:hypothetical protein
MIALFKDERNDIASVDSIHRDVLAPAAWWDSYPTTTRESPARSMRSILPTETRYASLRR